MRKATLSREPWAPRFVVAIMLALLCACGTDPPEEAGPDVPDVTEVPATTQSYIPMTPEAALSRATMALTGLRPTPDELEAVRQDPERLTEIVATYVERPEFGETIKDMYAEILLIRSTNLVLPNLGPLAGRSRSSIQDALSEEPLNLIREVAMSDAPFTEIVTADWTMLDALGAEIWDGHDYDDAEGGLQRVTFTDGRPSGGVLSTGPFLVRHESNGANYHRGRASVLSDMFLCEPFGGRDIPITGDVDLSDDAAVANALNENPQCVACHQVVDPLAQHFWPFRPRLPSNQIVRGYDDGCTGNSPCYPVPMFFDLSTLDDGEPLMPWENLGLRAPNYWGADTESLTDVGLEMAEDPRFARCAVEQFAAYLAQTSRGLLDPEFVGRHHLNFVASGYSAKALAQALVLDDWFLASAKHDTATASTPEVSGTQVVRPEQFERFIEALTGFRLVYGVPQQNIGEVRTLKSDLFGFRAMAGGIDGNTVTEPVHTATPVKLLVLAGYAEEAAGFVVDADFTLDAAERRLLTLVEEADSGEPEVRVQLAELHAWIFGHIVPTDDASITDLYELWSAVAIASSPAEGWKAVLTAMFQAPDAMFY
ncbi:MAG: hypothetical protein ACPGU1_10105 [Myxococcota bacterium]